MDSKKVALPGSERHPAGTRVGAVADDETVEVSVILKPKARVETHRAGRAVLSREEFAAAYGADPAAIERVQAFAREYGLKVAEIAPERRTVKL
jgi:kumamolisin